MMKKDSIPRILQATLSRFIHRNIPTSTFGALITITSIKVNANMSIAKIFFSFLAVGKEESQGYFLKKIEEQKYTIKKYLASELRHTLRTIPQIQFYLDQTSEKAVKIGRLLSSL